MLEADDEEDVDEEDIDDRDNSVANPDEDDDELYDELLYDIIATCPGCCCAPGLLAHSLLPIR